MRGLWSTIGLTVVLACLGGYIYFVTWKTTPESASTEEKVFATLETDKIDELKVTSDKGDVTTLKKSNGTWQLTAPAETAADDTTVSAIVSALGSVTIVRVVDENPGDLKDYGLAMPRLEVDYKAGGGDYQKLLIGDKSPTGANLFAKKNDDKRVFLIGSFQESTFNKTTFELRDKVVLKFDRDKVDGVEVTADGKSVIIAKDNADWKLTQPVQARADYGSVEGLIGRLQTTAMKSIVTEAATPADLKQYGLDRPVATVNLKMGSASATFAVGGKATGSADANAVYARDVSKPVVVTVDAMLADDLKKGAAEYRKKDVFDFRPFNITRLEVTRAGQAVAFEKSKTSDTDPTEKWKRVSPTAADVDKDKMEGLLNRLSNMRAASFVDTTARTGLDAPAMSVVAKFDEGKKEERVSFGKADPDVYAQKPGEPGAAKVEATDFTEAMKTLDELSK